AGDGGAGVLRCGHRARGAAEEGARHGTPTPPRPPPPAPPPRLRPGHAGAEQTRSLEKLSGLERTALQVALDRGLRIVRLRALESLAAREREARSGERRDGPLVPRRGQLGERTREQVVACGA